MTVLAIGRAGGGDLLREVCSDHLEAALQGAKPISAGSGRMRGRRSARRG